MKKLIVAVVLSIVIVISILGFFYFNNRSSSNLSESTISIKDQNTESSTMGSSSDTNSNTKVITIDAKKFEFTPNMIKVKKGDNVKIVLNNEDFAHGISIPDFNVKGIDSVEFTADKTGTFQFRCPTICGSGHREMTGNLVVEE